MAPRVSIVVRSYNRIAAMCDLLPRLLAQRHDSFEIVIVEQSTDVDPRDQARFDEIAADPRVRVLRHPPLGGARARNVGVDAARGEIVILTDDDDVPEGDDWINAHLANFDDPLCLGVTGRQKYSPDEDGSPYRFERIAYYRCQRFSPLLKLPWVCVRHTRRKQPIDNITGGNSSFRRSVFERFGGWDEDTNIEDEASFGYRVQRHKEPGEYFVFDPRAVLVRGRDVPGGLDKRYMTGGQYFERFMRYVHNIIGRYFPWRVRLLYPLYVGAVTVWTISWFWDDSQRHSSPWRRIASSIAIVPAAPYHAARSLARYLREAPEGNARGLRTHRSVPPPRRA